MQSAMPNLSVTSNALDGEVLALYRRYGSDQEIAEWLSEAFAQLTTIDFATADATQREAWLKQVFTNLRLQRLVQVGENEIRQSAHAEPYLFSAAQIDVLDILAAPDDWARVCVLGAGTYEMMLLRLRAMATMGCTLTSSIPEYVTRFCTEYNRFHPSRVTLLNDSHWQAVLASLRQSLTARPVVKKVEAPIARKSGRRGKTSAKQVSYPPVFSSWRERIITFSSVFGIVFLGLLIGFGSPAWILTGVKQNLKAQAARNSSTDLPARTVEQPTATPTVLATATPVTIPTATPTPTPTATPASTPTAPPTPVPTPDAAPTERAGFFVIGMAAREEANAQAEAQKQRAAGLNPRVVYSSHWSGLTPNYYQVVYGIFANRSETTALRQELDKRGIKTYVMHSGQRVRP